MICPWTRQRDSKSLHHVYQLIYKQKSTAQYYRYKLRFPYLEWHIMLLPLRQTKRKLSLGSWSFCVQICVDSSIVSAQPWYHKWLQSILVYTCAYSMIGNGSCLSLFLIYTLGDFEHQRYSINMINTDFIIYRLKAHSSCEIRLKWL